MPNFMLPPFPELEKNVTCRVFLNVDTQVKSVVFSGQYRAAFGCCDTASSSPPLPVLPNIY